MSNSTEVAARTYVAAAQERDRARRVEMLEACFAADARQVTRGGEVRGRDAIVAAFDAFYADPRGLSAHLTSAIDLGRTTFRFRASVENGAGTPPLEFHEFGEVDADGRIALLLTFDGALPESER